MSKYLIFLVIIFFQVPKIDRGLMYGLYGNLSLLSYPTNRRMWFLLSDVFSYLCISKIPLTKTLHIPNSKTGNKCNGHILGQLEIKISYLLGYLRHCRGMKKICLGRAPCDLSAHPVLHIFSLWWTSKVNNSWAGKLSHMGHFRGIIGFSQQMAPEVSLFHFSRSKSSCRCFPLSFF